MENFQAPDFKFSLRERKKIQQWEWFEPDQTNLRSPSYDDYILLKRHVESEPILGYIVSLFGGRLAKKQI